MKQHLLSLSLLLAAGLFVSAVHGAPATFTVNSTADTDDGACTTDAGGCTLREAINAANAKFDSFNPSTLAGDIDTIAFNIPGQGVKTISPATRLPPIINPVIIDGYTQPGASPNTLASGNNAVLLVEIDGTNITHVGGEQIRARSGLRFIVPTSGLGAGTVGGSLSTARGLIVNRCPYAGIYIEAGLVTIQGNFIGTNAAGTVALGNKEIGVLSHGSENKIGGTAPAERNVISGNLKLGLAISGFEDFSAGSVLGNYIGTDASGTAPLGNGEEGVGAGGSARIGGTAAGEPNLIAYNGKAGMTIGVFSTDTKHDVRVTRNSIFSNGGLGIDVQAVDKAPDGVTPNDPGDTSGQAQNFPILTDVSTSGNSTTVSGTLNTRPSETFTIEFYSNATCDPSRHGEGETFVGSTSVTTNSSGAASFSVPLSFALPTGYVITATATTTRTDRFGTSEFSPCLGLSSRLANISTRLRVETGDNALIGGFIVTGTQLKKVIIRAIGPSLPLTDRLANPTLELRDSSGALLDSNDNWVDSPNKQAIIDSTIPPMNDLESAIVATLPANNSGYTAIVRGANGTTGIGVVEAYDLDGLVDSRLANISTRGLVQSGDHVLIAGTIVLGQASRNVIIRAIGPSLNVSGKLPDPTLQLVDANGSQLAFNDNWRTGGQEAEIIATTIPPTNDFEAAIVAILPGNGASYTAVVRGANGTIGIAVVEVYALN